MIGAGLLVMCDTRKANLWYIFKAHAVNGRLSVLYAVAARAPLVRGLAVKPTTKTHFGPVTSRMAA
jgi:hypothetical protein